VAVLREVDFNPGLYLINVQGSGIISGFGLDAAVGSYNKEYQSGNHSDNYNKLNYGKALIVFLYFFQFSIVLLG
jgi:hypothetical protein